MKPHIRKVRTQSNFYLYDVNTNNFLKVDEVVYKIIDDVYRLSEREITNRRRGQFGESTVISAIKSIKENARNGLFSARSPQQFKPIFTNDEIANNLKCALMNLCLEVTQRCNLRCKYCSYSGGFRHKREHNSVDMSFDIAKKAIDYFLEHSLESENRFITFYGGEPLLNIALIEKCIEYIIRINAVKNIHFGITTNGTLLRKHIIDFLKKNNFMLTVSLDGPQDIHDEYRVYPSNKGTYETINKNLKLLRCREYPSSSIKFNITIVRRSKLNEQMKFFDRLCEEMNMKCNLNPYYVNVDESKKGFVESLRIDYQSRNIKLEQKFKQDLIIGHPDSSPFLKALFLDRYRRIYNRGSFTLLDNTCSPNGACIPGWEKLFVDSKGNYYICEKMTDFAPIGDIINGISYKRVFDILYKYCKMCESDCSNCWAIRLCKACYVAAKRNKELSLEEKRIYCRNSKKNLLKDMIFYLEVLENNLTAFEFISSEMRFQYIKKRIDFLKAKTDNSN